MSHRSRSHTVTRVVRLHTYSDDVELMCAMIVTSHSISPSLNDQDSDTIGWRRNKCGARNREPDGTHEVPLPSSGARAPPRDPSLGHMARHDDVRTLQSTSGSRQASKQGDAN
jgi:hypothetical protein